MGKSKEINFQEDIEYRTYRIKHFAQKHGWLLMRDTGTSFIFKNFTEGPELTIDYNNLEIETSLIHPEWGNTVLIRKGKFTQKIIESIFRNPREHMPEKVQSIYKDISTK